MSQSPRTSSHDDHRYNKAVDILLVKDPTKSVPAAMLAAGFSLDESRDRTKQMRIRRRIPPKRPKKSSSESQLQAGSVPLPQQSQSSTQLLLSLHKQELPETSSAVVISEKSSEVEWTDGDDTQHEQQVKEEIPECAFHAWNQGLEAEEWIGGEDWEEVDDEFECALRDWISCHRDDCIIVGQEQLQQSDGIIIKPVDRKYLEQTAQILYSLACKIIDGGVNSGGGNNNNNNNNNNVESGDEKILLRSDFITVANIVVTKSTTFSVLEPESNGQLILSADFIRREDSSFCQECEVVEAHKKYAAMHSLAQIAYAMCLRGDGPKLPDFFPRNCGASSEASILTALSLRDDSEGGEGEEAEIMDMIRKQFRVAESEDNSGSGFNSALLDAGIPLPMRRFISDLLGDEHGGMFRLERAFASFEDVISDLTQMTMNPDRFLHGDNSDRWKIVFDDKLYGREAETDALMIVAERVARVRNDGAQSERLYRLAGKKSEVVMVSGHSGTGKSRLVRLGGACLEEKGWLILQCKFDLVAHPEPLSVLARSLDAYLRSLAMCPVHRIHRRRATAPSHTSTECSCSGRSQQVRARLKHMIFPQGLGMLAKHIPSLKLLLDIAPPLDSPGMNESMMASLFRKLLQAISSKETPILFFLDDLQWADTLSLSLLVEIVKEASPDLNSSFSNIIDSQTSNLDDEAYIMFIGSYRDNEVDNTHPLAKVLCKFRGDNSLNVTEISLSCLSRNSLNDMLSDTLSLPTRRVRPLSELVIQKTGGHPLHVIEFIHALTANKLLTHCFSKGWEWDEGSIDIFPITDSVAELYSFKLRRLPNDILLGIQILSCFGFQVNQQVLDFVAEYDGQDSVDMKAVLQVATGEGLIERAGPLISFSHDMILKASLDSIQDDDLIPLLRKLIKVLIKEASAYDALDSVLFVAVDLINRIGSKFTTMSKERALFAELNLRAGVEAVAAPDFAGAAVYAENGISFLSDTCWETQYELCIQLYEISVLSLFPSLTGDRRKLMHRINDVFEHARNFTDKFKTHIVWVQLLAASDLTRAIDECLNALLQLGEPLDFENVDYDRVCSELVKQKEEVNPSEFLETMRLADMSKVRAMKVMSLLLQLYQQRKSLSAAFVSCKMVELSMKYGTCEESIHGVAAFAAAMKNILGFIHEGNIWGRTALLLLKSFGDKPSLIPPVYAEVYGSDLLVAEPVQSTLEPLSLCLRFAVETGNEFAFTNSVYYLLKSFGSGKNLKVLIDEVFICVRQFGCHLGNDSSYKTPSYNLFIQFFFTPLYNILRGFEESNVPIPDCQGSLFPFDHVQLVDNYSVLKAAMDLERFNFVLMILTVQTPYEFMSRNMEMALKCSQMYFEHFLVGDKPTSMLSGSVPNIFFNGLINFYFMRQTGDERYKVRGEKALNKLNEWSAYSEWNFKHKQLLLEAEFHYSMNNSSRAATCYDASIEAAHEHKFIHMEAIANELAGLFFLEEGKQEQALSYFKQSTACYRAWGAYTIAKRVEAFIEKELSTV